MRKKDFLNGLVQGIPIALGYLSVSFGFGIMAVRAGLSVTDASLISLLNVTSAGQAAGVDIIASNGTIIEMILVQLTINIRYALMALSLSQKLDSSFTFPKRLIAAYGITDEIFGLCIAQKGRLRPFIMYGIIFISVLGWVLGTFLGAAAGEILPKSITTALGIILYGMFIAIIIPPSRKSKNVLFVVILAAICSILFKFLLPMISSRFSVIICAIVSSVISAIVFPKEDVET